VIQIGLRSRSFRALKALAVVAIALGSLLPLAARAGEPGEAPPAAVRFSLSLRATAAMAGGDLALTADGVSNQTGEFQATINVTQPESHTMSLVRTGDTIYVSLDGGPYQTMTQQGLQSRSLGS